MRTVYMDNASTTEMKKEVLNEMLPFFCDDYGNPSSVHEKGRQSSRAVKKARKQVAELINGLSGEIYFTSGGTEADNWALRGAAEAFNKKGRHIITSSIEHHAVMHTCEYLQKKGFDITYLPVDSEGVISLKGLKESIRKDTVLISVMTANNETGTIQPVKDIGKIAKENGIVFHTDAVQAAGMFPVDVREMNIDMLSLSSHKIHGPKGVGVLYINRDTKIDPLIFGGKQEQGSRAGTENVSGIVGFGKAAELALFNMDKNTKKITTMRDKLIEGVLDKSDGVHLNGHRKLRLPGNANFSFDGVTGDDMVLGLDMHGICVSSGSACNSRSVESSHVLKAMGYDDDRAKSCIRFSISSLNTMKDIDYILQVLPELIKRLREF